MFAPNLMKISLTYRSLDSKYKYIYTIRVQYSTILYYDLVLRTRNGAHFNHGF